MVREAPLERTDAGVVPAGEGWFVLNGRDGRWRAGPLRPALWELGGAEERPQLGVFLSVLAPGEPMAMYHQEADQEDFLVLAGTPLLIVEGEERLLRPWDLFHCPPGTEHVILGAGDGPSVVLAVGARDRSTGENWGSYTVADAAVRHGAGVEEETSDELVAYARFERRTPTPYRHGWLPGS